MYIIFFNNIILLFILVLVHNLILKLFCIFSFWRKMKMSAFFSFLFLKLISRINFQFSLMM